MYALPVDTCHVFQTGVHWSHRDANQTTSGLPLSHINKPSKWHTTHVYHLPFNPSLPLQYTNILYLNLDHTSQTCTQPSPSIGHSIPRTYIITCTSKPIPLRLPLQPLTFFSDLMYVAMSITRYTCVPSVACHTYTRPSPPTQSQPPKRHNYMYK